MDQVIENLMKHNNDVEEYASITREIMKSTTDVKEYFNMKTVLCIAKLKSLEIEYYAKYQETGAACFLFEQILRMPSSKIWALMQKELTNSLQYWLQALKIQYARNNVLWWEFLSLILKFIQEICFKDLSIPDVLVELTSQSLFDIATMEGLNVEQRYEVLYCVCLYSSASSREARLNMRDKCNHYFTKVAELLCSCGYVPLQTAALEALLRWLVPRGDAALRAAAAAAWLPPERCPRAAADFFLTATWHKFFEDSRAFLNVLNDASESVTSVPCKQLSIGDEIICHETWLDVSAAAGAVSVTLAPAQLRAVSAFRAYQALVLRAADTRAAILHSSAGGEACVRVELAAPARLQPSGLAARAGAVAGVLAAAPRRLHAALRQLLGDKYQVQGNIDLGLTLSPIQRIRTNYISSNEDTCFSDPSRQRPTGFGNRNLPQVFDSPFSTSLSQPHDNPETLQRSTHSQRDNYISVKPQLSTVSEISETDDQFSLQTTIKYNPFTVGVSRQSKKKVNSNSELIKNDPKKKSQLSVVNDERPVINETIEHLSKSKEYQTNIVDLLIQEALQARTAKVNHDTQQIVEDSGIENSLITEVKVNNRQGIRSRVMKKTKKRCVVVSATDESNTEAIVDVNENKSTSCDSYTEVILDTPARVHQKTGPTLAKKMNSSAYNTSESVDHNLIAYFDNSFDIDNIVTECVNGMITTVCEETNMYNNIRHSQDKNMNDQPEKKSTDLTTEPEKVDKKMKNKPAKNKASDNADVKRKLDNAKEESLTKRRRKLYSPKDNGMNVERNVQTDTENEENIVFANLIRSEYETPKTTKTKPPVSCYKAMDVDKKRRVRLPRSRKSRVQFQKTPSPDSRRNDAIFDQLKSTRENDEKLTYVDSKSLDAYNFTSEDEDFENKNVSLRKKVNLKLDGSESVKPKRQIARSNNYGISSNNETKNTKQARKKPAPRKINKKKGTSKTEKRNQNIKLEDERMRAGTSKDLLNTSMVVAKHDENSKDIDFAIDKYREMEPIPEEQESRPKQKPQRKKPNTRTKSKISERDTEASRDNDRSTTLSPLPALIVEREPAVKSRVDELEEEIFRTVHEMASGPSKDPRIEMDEIDIVGVENLVEPRDRNVSKNKKQKKKPKSKSKVKDIDEIIDIVDELDPVRETSVSLNINDLHKNMDESPSRLQLEKESPPRYTVDMNGSLRRKQCQRSKHDNVVIESEKRSSSASPFHLFHFQKMVPSRRTSDSSSDRTHVLCNAIHNTEKQVKEKLANEMMKPVQYRRTESSNADQETHKSKTTSKKIQKFQVKKNQDLINSPIDDIPEKQPVVSVVPIPREIMDKLSSRSAIKMDTSRSSEEDKYVYNTRKNVKNIIQYSKSTSDEGFAKKFPSDGMANTLPTSRRSNIYAIDDTILNICNLTCLPKATTKVAESQELSGSDISTGKQIRQEIHKFQVKKNQDLINSPIVDIAEKQPVVSVMPIPRAVMDRLSSRSSTNMDASGSAEEDKYVYNTRKNKKNVIQYSTLTADEDSEKEFPVNVNSTRSAVKSTRYSKNLPARKVNDMHSNDGIAKTLPTSRPSIISPIDDTIINICNLTCLPKATTKVAESQELSDSDISTGNQIRQEIHKFQVKKNQDLDMPIPRAVMDRLSFRSSTKMDASGSAEEDKYVYNTRKNVKNVIQHSTLTSDEDAEKECPVNVNSTRSAVKSTRYSKNLPAKKVNEMNSNDGIAKTLPTSRRSIASPIDDTIFNICNFTCLPKATTKVAESQQLSGSDISTRKQLKEDTPVHRVKTMQRKRKYMSPEREGKRHKTCTDIENDASASNVRDGVQQKHFLQDKTNLAGHIMEEQDLSENKEEFCDNIMKEVTYLRKAIKSFKEFFDHIMEGTTQGFKRFDELADAIEKQIVKQRRRQRARSRTPIRYKKIYKSNTRPHRR